tara:strand:+ start:813 stop:1136 length:324 start_codon:yes stop_codon:yes gene_type:complete
MSWILKKEDKYTLYSPEFFDVSSLEKSIKSFKTDVNKIIDCSTLELSNTAIDLLAKAYDLHVSSRKSFVVIISDAEDIDALDEYFIVVPTISEAIEYIYMEELEKTL